MKDLRKFFVSLLLLCTTVATAQEFEVDGIYYNITDEANKTVEVIKNKEKKNTGSVVIPESVTYNDATYSVTTIGVIAFQRCSGLTSITIPNSVKSIGSSAFFGCSGLTNVTIPNSVTSIGNSTFEECSKLETLYIGKAIEAIGDKAFSACDKITEIRVAIEKPIKGNKDIFTDMVYDNATLYIPNDTKYLYEKREPWNMFFYIQEMDFTGIEDVKCEDIKVKGVYDLHGKKVENPTNGIYIINGKKVFVK